jgi:excisionase family DNA binding protein
LLFALDPPNTALLLPGQEHIAMDLVKIIPIRTAFRQLAISNATGYRLIKRRELWPTIKIGRLIKIEQSAVERFIKSHQRE